MGPEESDCQGSCLILYACNQSVVVALDVEHHSAALENARFWIRRLHLSWGAPLSAPHNGKPSIVLRPCAWHEFPKMEDAQSMQRNSAVHPPVGVGEARLRQRPGRSVLCAGVHVVRLVGRARLQRYNTSSRDRITPDDRAQIAERWRATGSQIRSRLLLSCNSSESLGNIAFLHFVIPDTTQRTGESFLDIKVDGRNPASRIGIGQRRRKLALVTRTVGLAASSVGFVFNLAICIRAITSSARFMSILVTGGAGYIGSHMVRDLADAGERVIVLDNLSTGFDWAIPKGVPLVVGDTGDQNLVGQILREHEVQSIIHFAASAIVPDSVKDPLGYYKNNTVNSRALIETAVKNDLRQFIFSSTCAVYGNPAQVPVTEDTMAAPISPYGWSKLMTEIMLRDAGTAHGLSHVILRYFNVAGADPGCRTGQSSKNATHLIKVAVEAALGLRPKVDIYGIDYPTPDGTCIRDYIHVSDLVRAHSDALRYLRAGGASLTLNCGYGHGCSVREVIEMVKRVSGVDFKVEVAARRPGNSAQIIAASERARTTLGWEPQYDDLATIIGHALAWEQRLREGAGAPIMGR